MTRSEENHNWEIDPKSATDQFIFIVRVSVLVTIYIFYAVQYLLDVFNSPIIIVLASLIRSRLN